MRFGKYKGRALTSIPEDYLDWLLTIDLRPQLRRAVERELRRRAFEEEPDPRPERPATRAREQVDWSAIITRWFREMCLKYHPDRGGSNEAMQAINAAHERLRELTTLEMGGPDRRGL
jgi:hypothetical protein